MHPGGGGVGGRLVGGGELDAGEGDLGGARGEPARVEHPLAHGRRRRHFPDHLLARSVASSFGSLGIGIGTGVLMSELSEAEWQTLPIECRPPAGAGFRFGRLCGQGKRDRRHGVPRVGAAARRR